ncbi:MAG: type II toxin-antitoxin system CcdA family antitoxin [Chloroflexi bacterium]|nr:type II toxin-antitoxin system CcdA family antitoxin [Chloroflexota bacterium]
MEKTNITLSLPKDLLRQTKLIAVKRNISVSRLLTEALRELVQRESGYAYARKRQLSWMETGFDMGSQGRSVWIWTREELHER